MGWLGNFQSEKFQSKTQQVGTKFAKVAFFSIFFADCVNFLSFIAQFFANFCLYFAPPACLIDGFTLFF